ncbi:hypothetical protein LOD99_11300 [Oopsacas minuta]|uniref:Uncharacterized protein n=1 Tax=Oopsacas minuta TaxID=111878 RepID=A0AAV7K5D5_9METZ|nr:hypothetical protein LOD99_11300 [Oopsacas minuta]
MPLQFQRTIHPNEASEDRLPAPPPDMPIDYPKFVKAAPAGQTKGSGPPSDTGGPLPPPPSNAKPIGNLLDSIHDYLDLNNNSIQILSINLHKGSQFGSDIIERLYDMKLNNDDILILDKSNSCLHIFNKDLVLQKSIISI